MKAVRFLDWVTFESRPHCWYRASWQCCV